MKQLSNREAFAEWRTGSVGRHRTYFLPGSDDQRSAYVFEIQVRGNTEGYVTVSAHRALGPVLEYSRADPPGLDLDRASTVAAEAGSNGSDKLVYSGGLSYGLQVDDRRAVKFAGMPVQEVESNHAISNLQQGTRTARTAWETVDEDPSVSTASADYYMLGGVPAFHEAGQSDDSGGPNYPNNVGTTDDPWDGWDGCIPYAGANVIGYHENIDQYDWQDRESLIDRMHEMMNTSSSGWTEWKDIPPAISNYSRGQHDYGAKNPWFIWNLKGDLKNALHKQNPPILNLNGGGKKGGKGGKGYGDHSVAVKGYESRNDGFFWGLSDGWANADRWLQHGNWGKSQPTFVWTK